MPESSEDFRPDFKSVLMFKRMTTLVFMASIFFACKAPQTQSGYYDYDTQCLGNLGDGTQLVKSMGTGLDRKQAEADAYKNALRDILFKGIRNGTNDCSVQPLIVKPNAQENYEVYFNNFFSQKGAYKDFVARHREPFLDRNFKSNPRSDAKLAYVMELKIYVSDLKNFLIEDQIID